MINFGKNLKIALKRRRISSKQLASIVGVRPNTISNYITGVSSPSYDVLQKILQELNVSSDDLLFKDFAANPSILDNVAPSKSVGYHIEGAGRALREDELLKSYYELLDDFIALKDKMILQQGAIIAKLQEGKAS